jgi:two-component system nitrate/nitrite response regulator NarL
MSYLAVLGAHSLVRAGLVSLLTSFGYDKVTEGATLDDLKKAAESGATPDALLVYVSGSTDIRGLMLEIRNWAPSTKVVIISPELDLDLLAAGFAAGATGYLLENLTSEALRSSLRLVYEGEKVFPSKLAAVISEIASEVAGRGDACNGADQLQNLDLVPREVEILRLLTNGQPNKAIASTLQIPEPTVKLHLRNILRKLGVSNRTQAALWAMQHTASINRADRAAATEVNGNVGNSGSPLRIAPGSEDERTDEISFYPA